MPQPTLLDLLARVFVAGEPVAGRIAGRTAQILGRNPRWLLRTIARYCAVREDCVRPRVREVIRFLLRDRYFARYSHKLDIHQFVADPPRMQPIHAASAWDVPRIETVAALAEWLGLTPDELAWFADLKDLNATAGREPLIHYRYRVLTKRSGAVRLIEAPKPRLKELQRRILAGILDRIPSHPAVHGFVKRRSIKTFVAPHTGRPIVLRMDLTDFFPTFSAGRIQAFFRTAGYPETVADLLAGICTNAARVPGLPFDARVLYRGPHLPQGAPTSPAIANICFHRMDCRLAGLARSAGAAYTRCADDLAFSGDEAFARRAERFSTHVAALLFEEGFHVNHRKTRIMRQGVRQRLAGLTANQRVNVTRPDFDRLKAILTNCVRQDPALQNRDAHPNFRAHLEGRVAFMESVNPTKARRLRAIFDRIVW